MLSVEGGEKMQYYNTRNRNNRVSFREAVTRGLSDSMGLFMPEHIPVMEDNFFRRLPAMELPQIAFEVGRRYTGDEIPPDVLMDICDEAFSFPVEIVDTGEGRSAVELFHGPTAAFKDFGARFMSRCFRYFAGTGNQHTVVLVATSGDTGGAVASSFHGLTGMDVIILYPYGKVSPLQESQIASWGDNITAIGVEGSFDDCQEMVKRTFAVSENFSGIRLTSANSINIARLIPQSFYYYFSVSRIDGEPPVVAVPSGNFGNLTAGLMAWKSGLKTAGFIAATNVNKVVPSYIETGIFKPADTIPTVANAMDVGNPSNFERLTELFDNDYNAVREVVSGYWFDDREILGHIRDEYSHSGYLLDPHGAVASLALSKYLENHPAMKGIFMATAHPAKFSEVIGPVTGIEPAMPARLQEQLMKEKRVLRMESGYQNLISFLKTSYQS